MLLLLVYHCSRHFVQDIKTSFQDGPSVSACAGSSMNYALSVNPWLVVHTQKRDLLREKEIATICYNNINNTWVQR